MNRYEFIVNDDLILIEHPSDMLSLFDQMIRDEKVIIIDRNYRKSYSTHGATIMSAIILWLNDSQAMGVDDFFNSLKEVLN
jgi:hypothetical protein